MQQVAQGLASLGRGNDKMLVHMTPGEVHGLQRLAMAHGGSLTINPHTGLPEAGFLSSLLPLARGAGAMMIPGMQPWGAAMLVGGGYGLATGSLAKGLQAGLGAYGGAGIGEGLANFGAEQMGPNMGPQLEQQIAPRVAQQATQDLVATGANTAGLIPGTETAGYFGPEAGMNMDMAKGYGYTPPGSEAPLSTEPMTRRIIPGGPTDGVRLTATSNVLSPAPMPTTQPIASAADLVANQNQMPGMQPPIEAPSRFDQMLSGAQKAYDKPMDFLKTKGIPSAIASAAAPLVSSTLSGMIQPQGLQGLVPQTTSAPNYPNYSYQQTRNPKFGQPGEPYYIQNYVKMAAGGQVPQPSMPIDLSQNYPGSNITKSSYATLPSTDSQEVVDGYGPKINPFTGAEGMAAGGLAGFNSYGFSDGYNYNPDNQTYSQGAAGADDQTANNIARYLQTPSGQGYSGSGMPDLSNIGINASGPSMVTNGMPPDAINALQHSFLGSNLRTMAKGGVASGNLADFKMYPDQVESSGVEDLSATQLEAAADSDDAYLMGSASLERDRRKGSGTKGYKRKEFAYGGMASLPEYAAGGKLLRGAGDGMSDDIPAVIKGDKPQRAALADGEFVVPADVVSHLGNGSTDAGAKRLYGMMDKVRQARTGRKAQGRQIKAEKYIPA